MTNPEPEAATFLVMTRNPVRRPALACLSLLLPWSALRADEPALSELLRDALYTEEVARDSEKAAKQYEELLARHDAQKTFAAAALFRLAEVRRKQDRKDDAIQLYQRLIAEFPYAETETKRAKENLAVLG
ncbi:MAG TPA: tetratricopeptide repeat protein, partial [Luteolibacter sp.]|nr:tetratricopeptide repeat protein [Luteolibacter sp.]